MKQLFHRRHWKIEPHHQKIYLTFDDGPIPEVTPWVLELLKKHNAKASFFCIGDNIQKNPEIFKQIIAEGHAIGNHTQNHLNGWKTDIEVYLENIEKCQNSMARHQVYTNLFRPPYGKCTHQQAHKLRQKGMQLIMWDVLTKDYDKKVSKEKAFNVYQKTSEAGSIVVLHDSLKAFETLSDLLPRILESKPEHLEFAKIEF